MKFYSPTGELVHMALTSGHSFTIGPGKDAVEVPKMFQRVAMLHGCLPEGVAPDKVEEQKQQTKADLILAAVRQMLQAGAPEDLTAEGKPKVDKLSAMCGFAVDASERDAAYSVALEEDDGSGD